MSSIITRRKLLANLGKTAGACTVANLPFLVAGCGGGSSLVMPPPPGDGYSQNRRPTSRGNYQSGLSVLLGANRRGDGQIKDRAFAAGGNDNRPVSNIAPTGFGLAALCIGDQRGYQPTWSIINRAQTTLSFLSSKCDEPGGLPAGPSPGGTQKLPHVGTCHITNCVANGTWSRIVASRRSKRRATIDN